MADYVLVRKSRNIISEMMHAFLNILLGVGSVLITVLSGSPLIGIILVLISKWRIFAVRRRYLMVNIKSNLVDLIVGLSIVLLTYYTGTEFLAVDFILMAFYVVWLIFIKPASSEKMVVFQSLTAVFLGMSLVAIMTANLDLILSVILAFVIGYASSRHTLVQSSDGDFRLTTLISGLIFMEVTWLSQTWSIIYTFGSSGIRIPQIAIILTIFAFVYNAVRAAVIKYQDKLKFEQIALPVIFGVVMIGAVVLFFSEPIFNI